MGKAGTANKVSQRLSNARFGQCSGGKTVNRGLQRGGTDDVGVVAITPCMQDLQGNFAACRMDGLGDHTMLCHAVGIGQHSTVRQHPPCGIGGDTARNHQPHPAPRPRRIKRRHLDKAIGGFF